MKKIASKSVFVIMRISPQGQTSDIDRFYKRVIAPVARSLSLDAKPVDFTDGPDGISKRALALISESRFVVCDLTHERPNCYFEGGYALAKNIPCIWTARKDHDPRRHGRKKRDPKIHFDLDGLRITYWSEKKFEHARKDLAQRMALALLANRDNSAFDAAEKDALTTIGKLEIDWDRHQVEVRGVSTNLAPKEFELLKFLIDSKGKVVSRAELIAHIWRKSKNTPADSRTVDQHVARLRRKLRSEGARVKTVPNFGYRIILK